MPEAVFVVHLDDYQGFIVEKRYPASFTLNEKVLNLIFYEHEKELQENLRYTEIESFRVASFVDKAHLGWMVCFVLDPEEQFETLRTPILGMGRLILELMIEAPETVLLDQILERKSSLDEIGDEQKYAQVFLTPSSALLLEKMEAEGVEKAAKISIWLKGQVQTDSVDLREVIKPLMDSGLVKVEVVGKTTETVFLLRDLFGYRAPPVKAVARAKESTPHLAAKYLEDVTQFFTPPPPSKGYNPTIPSDDPNSPVFEDREKISRVLSKSLRYKVLKCLREEPLTVRQIADKTDLPEGVVQNALLALQSDHVTAEIGEGVWGLLTDPVMETFMPEFILPLIAKKLSAKEIGLDIVRRHLELLSEAWVVIND